MKLWRNYVLIAAALVVVGSIFLPNAAAGITDAKRLNNLNMVDSQSISFDAVPELSLPERIALVSSPDTEIMAWKSGQVMDFDAACAKVSRELKRFFSNSSFAFDFGSLVIEEGAAEFIIDSGNLAVNMIIWVFSMHDKLENTATVILDDETGLIMKIIYRQASISILNASEIVTGNRPSQSNEEFDATAHRLVDLMAEYYDLSVTLADYELEGIAYYRADIIGAGKVIPMYGVIKVSGFSMNETG